MNLPNDPIILLSFINMKLRNEELNLDNLCSQMDLEKSTIVEKLANAGFEYSVEYNKFW